jgi:hypothetical protein
MKSKFISIVLVLFAASALHAQKAETRFTFPGIAWGEGYARTAQVLREIGFAPAEAANIPARAFADDRGDTLYAAFDDAGGLETMTFAAHVQASDAWRAFSDRAQQLRQSLGEPDSASTRLAVWRFDSGDQLFLAREGSRLVEFYFSAEARAKLANDLASASQETDDAGAWYAARLQGTRWEPLTVGERMGVAYDPQRASRLADGTLDVWTRWDHAEHESNDDGSRYDSTLEHMRIDCAGERMMTLQLIEYDGTRVVNTLTPPRPDWEPTVPETLGEQVIQGICSAASGRR